MTPDEFRARRLAAGYSQAALARILRVEANTISRYERGRRRIPGPIEAMMLSLAPAPPSLTDSQIDALAARLAARLASPPP